MFIAIAGTQQPLHTQTNDDKDRFCRHAPEALGDYLAGPNHVLPTGRRARFSSGLSVLDFMKRTSLIGCTPEALAALGPAVVALARAEGLGAHALSVTIRLDDGEGDKH